MTIDEINKAKVPIIVFEKELEKFRGKFCLMKNWLEPMLYLRKRDCRGVGKKESNVY